DHGCGVGCGANSARSLDAGTVADHAAHERDVLRRGGAEKPGSGLDEVGFSREAELAGKDLLLQREERSLKYYFNNGAGSVGHFGHGDNVIAHTLTVTRAERANVHYHIELVSAQAQGFGRFEAFDGGVIGA